MTRKLGSLLLALAGALAVAVAVTGVASSEGPPERPDTRQVMFIGNNWDGTADVVDARTYERLARINMIPDKAERMDEITRNPRKLAFLLAIREAVGEGHDQFTDDMFTTHDGRLLAVSRPSFADVVGIDLATQKIVWRFAMEGDRSDHMGVSPDGRSLLVSDSTANKVHRLDLQTGRKTGEFASGDTPHESNYTKDGKRVFHASIGRVYTPTDRPELGLARDTSKGARYLQINDAESMALLERWDIGEKLAEFGRPDMESAVRPMAIAPDERTVFLQISFHHGFVEFDLETEKITRVVDLPIAEKTKSIPPEQYLLDSAHHGLAINPEGTKLCAAGTMSDYAAIVERGSFSPTIIDVGAKPYWSTNGVGGTTCWVSVAGGDEVVVIDYASAKEVRRIPVGDHPQRVRIGAVANDVLGALPAPTTTEDFVLGVFHKGTRTGVGVRGGRVNIGCRAEGARSLRLASCRVELRAAIGARRRTVSLGAGSASPADRRSFRVNVALNRAGRALVRRRPRGTPITIVATGRDSLGREQTIKRRVSLRRGLPAPR